MKRETESKRLFSLASLAPAWRVCWCWCWCVTLTLPSFPHPSPRVYVQNAVRVYIQNVPVCTGTTPACGNTCGRGAGAHGDVLNVHTEGVLNVHTQVFQPSTPHTTTTATATPTHNTTPTNQPTKQTTTPTNQNTDTHPTRRTRTRTHITPNDGELRLIRARFR